MIKNSTVSETGKPDYDSEDSYLSFHSEDSFELEIPQLTAQPEAPVQINPTSTINEKHGILFPKNLLWAFLFFAHLFIVAFFGLKNGIHQIKSNRSKSNQVKLIDLHLITIEYWLLYGIAAVLSFFLSIFIFFLLKWKTKLVLKVFVHSLCTYLAVVSISIFFQEQYFWGSVFLFASLFQFLFVISITDRLYFTILMIRQSFSILSKFKFVLWLTLTWMLTLLVWLTIWTLSIAGIIVMANEGDLKWWYILILCVSLFWTSAVFVNTLHLCVSAIITNYFFQLEYNDEETSRKLHLLPILRSLLFSFGSLCFGSLCCYPVRILRTMVRGIRSKTGSNECLFCCVNFFFLVVETLVRHFNKYGYVMLAMNHYGFNTSSLNAWELLQSTGVEVLVAYDLTSAVLLMGCFVCSLVTATLVTVFNWFIYHKHLVVIETVSVLISLVMMSIPMVVIEATVSSLYIIFAQNSSLLSKFNPAFALQMTKVWNRRLQHRSGKRISSSGEFVMQFS